MSGVGPLFTVGEAGGFGVLSLTGSAFPESGAEMEQPPANSSPAGSVSRISDQNQTVSSLLEKKKKNHPRIAAAASPWPGKMKKKLPA